MSSNQTKIKANLAKILTFLQQAEKLKSVMRHSWLSTGRRESVAEHSWRICLMAMLLEKELETKVEIAKVLKMLTVHDLAEIYAGDHIAWHEKLKNKHALEEKGLKKLVAKLPQYQKKEIVSLWLEYEGRKTNEAKFAKALDKLETIDQHNLADLSTWEPEEYPYNLVHGTEEAKYSRILKSLKDLIDTQTRKKISQKTRR